MKNRYGIDGLTFAVKADTSTGHFEVYNYNVDANDDETYAPKTQSNSYDSTDKFDKEKLRAKYDPSFFNLTEH